MANIPEASKLPDVKLLDNPMASDLYADGVAGVFFEHGNIRIAFEAHKMDHSTSPQVINRVVVGRLVMPVAQAALMAQGLLQYLASLKQDIERTKQTSGSIN